MKTNTTHTAFCSELPQGGAAPEWVHLLPAGTFAGRDGRGPYTVRDPQALITHSLSADGANLVIDENHSTDLAAPKGGPSPAMARILQMEARADGMWGKVEWNAQGKKLVEDRSYRFLSPVFDHADDGTVLCLQRASLTNTPNLRLGALNHQKETAVNPLEEALRKALALPDADPAALAAALNDRLTQGAAATAAVAATATAVGLEPNAKPEEVLTALNSKLAKVGGGETEMQALQTKVTALQSMMDQRDGEEDVDSAIRDRRAAPAERKALMAVRGKLGRDTFREMMAARPQLLAEGPKKDAVAPAQDGVDIGRRATALMSKRASAGSPLTATDAVALVMAGKDKE
jgi:phage I-like protein